MPPVCGEVSHRVLVLSCTLPSSNLICTHKGMSERMFLGTSVAQVNERRTVLATFNGFCPLFQPINDWRRKRNKDCSSTGAVVIHIAPRRSRHHPTSGVSDIGMLSLLASVVSCRSLSLRSMIDGVGRPARPRKIGAFFGRRLDERAK